ncbi:response regulator [Methanothrix soehngenii]|uniref:response regulator n=1 Tax=Methanothrix soehngenii TaxID=2223 RepID=UPI00300C4166
MTTTSLGRDQSAGSLDLVVRISDIAATVDDPATACQQALALLIPYTRATAGAVFLPVAGEAGSFVAADVSADHGSGPQAADGSNLPTALAVATPDPVSVDSGGRLLIAVRSSGAVVAVLALLLPDGSGTDATADPATAGNELHAVCTLVGRSLGRVADRQAATEQAASRNTALESEVRRRNDSLTLARQRASAASRAAEAFFTALSHDLKTPLHTILAVLDQPENAPGSADRSSLSADQCRLIRAEAADMLTRVDHLLSLSPRGSDRDGPSQVIVASALTPALSAYREVLALQGQRLSVGLAEDVNEPVLTDSEILLQALDAVMARIVPAGGSHTVHIDVRFGGPRLLTLVTCPNGILTHDDLAALTSPMAFDGAVVTARQTADEVQVEIDVPAHRLTNRRRSSLRQVLLVDDNVVTRRLGAAMITALGYPVTSASSGAEAIEALRSSGFGLVLMDIRMPERDGLSTVAGIRAGEAGAQARETPIVALTANAAPGDAGRSLLAGMDAHVTKPFTKAQLAAVLTDYISPSA